MFGKITLLALLPLLEPVGAVENEEKIVSIGLIPHAVQRRRLLAENGYVPEELVPDRPRQYQGRRQLQQGGDPTPVSELFQGYGTHYADLWCGTPPQRQTVIVVRERQSFALSPGIICPDNFQSSTHAPDGNRIPVPV